MAITPFGNMVLLTTQQNSAIGVTATTNAAAENVQIVGNVVMAAGSGTKTISAAGGGSIFVSTGAVTFATASSEIRVGVEDVNANGLGDGTQDVFGARVAATDTIAANTFIDWAMTSGSKTVTHGDRVAITVRMPTRAGVDSVVWLSWGSAYIYTTGTVEAGRPYGVVNGSKNVEMLWAMLVFDDGTYGWVQGMPFVNAFASTGVSVNTGTTPDEYAGTFTVPVPTRIEAIGAALDDAATGDNFELILYSDPYGTPSALQTVAITILPDALISTTDTTVLAFIAATTLSPGTVYGVAVRPTTANSITYYHITLGSTSGLDPVKDTIPFFKDVKLAARSNQTGAFAETNTFDVPLLLVGVTGFDDGAADAGGGAVQLINTTGLVA